MLQVKTYIDKSSIDGMGLFAAEDITKGTIIWEFNPWGDIVLSDSGFVFNRIEMEFIDKYSFYDKQLDKWIVSGDNDRFTNHSDSPNTEPLPDGRMVASIDIKKGEEITSDYYEIDFDVNLKFNKTNEQ